MKEIAYTPKNLRRAPKHKDIIKISEFKTSESLDNACKASLYKLNQGKIWDGAVKSISINNKSAYIILEPTSILVHNTLAKNIQKIYDIKFSHRDLIVRLLISHLNDSHQFIVHRLDIKSFYESFKTKEIINKLKGDGILSNVSIDLLSSLLSSIENGNLVGLPRGVGISSTLSELMMHDFDHAIKSNNDVLFYNRFVDDIIIISTPKLTKNNLTILIQDSKLPLGLEFHTKGDKVAFRQISKTSTSNNKISSFDFLGYTFKISTTDRTLGDTLLTERRVVDVTISNGKIKRIKDRVIKSFCSFISSKQPYDIKYALLRKRILFLTRNYTLTKSQHPVKTFSGIYFNYKYITDTAQLKELDAFLASILLSSHSNLSRRTHRVIGYRERLALSKISFLDGFTNKKFCKFSYKDLKEIKSIWNY
ncbi:reverse transcriptase domain-containing protein [Plesiomonas shigelloides]|uniref:antiviral reverse transcriptase Drt3a n=1 Tax=Plesiomonas shigelloides TaxID=703 RepID=UPI0030BE2780